MIVYVKYGFETTPVKMYNTNVSSAILLSFLKATCIKDIDEHCKQRNIQLSIELDAIRRSLQHRKSIVEASTASPTATPASSRPPSGSSSASAATLDGDTPPPQRPPSASATASTGSAKQSVGQDLSDEAAAVRVKKETLEKQLETVNAAAKLVKELIAGVAWVDLVDQSGTRMNLDSAGNTRVNMLLTARQQYTAVAVSSSDEGDVCTTPLVFKLGTAP